MRYFQTKTKTGGSFVKVAKVDRGISLCDALLGRFDGAGTDSMPFENAKTGYRKDMQFVGFDKVVERQAQLDLLQQVKLLDAGVSHCGDLGKCPNLEALLLEQSLLSSWEPVVEALQNLPALTTLSLSDNRVGHVRGSLAGPFKLKVLVLNGCGVGWEDCVELQKACPSLDELYLRNNAMGLPPAGTHWAGVTNLVLDDNNISDWGVLESVTAAFPDLKTLQLNDNALFEGVPEKIVVPAGLTSLSLGNNLVATFAELGRLIGTEPLSSQLTSFRAAENPLSVEVFFRQLIIAVMPNLVELNGSAVKPRERVNGERTLLSLDVQGKAEASMMDPDGTHRARLRAVHGDGIAGSEEVGNLSNSLVKVELVPVAANIVGRPSVTKKVPNFLEISEFKVLVHKLFKVPLETLRLVFHEDGAVAATALEDGDLRAYGIMDGCQVQVQDTSDDFESKK